MIPRNETPPPIADISAVIDFALKYNENLAMADLATIRYWTNCGCDVQLDILPTMERVTKAKRGSKIGSFSYFTNPVLESKDRRAVAAKVEPKKELSQEEKDAARARTLRWARDKGVTSTALGPQDFRWLEEYEAKKKPPSDFRSAGACMVSDEVSVQTA